jgi:diacylglycerol kinase family enzyme
VRQAVLIVNPFASGVTEERIAAVERALGTAAEVRTLLTERPGHAVELAEGASGDGVDAIVVFSGDGGYNEAANGADGRIPLGFVPGGGTSVLARALGLPREPVAAAHALADAIDRGRSRRITVGRVNGRRFTFTAGIGLDAELVRRVDALGRDEDGHRPGDLAFARVAAGLLAERRGRFEPALEVDGLGRAAFVLVANCDPFTYAGRMPLRITPEARFELGLDLVAPRAVRPVDVPRLLAYLATGRPSLRGRRVAYAHDLDRIEVVCDRPLPLQADGEDLGDVERAELEAEREALPVLV